MADRVSTIRFKVEGTPEVTSKIEELNRQIIRQQRALAQAAKEATQAQVGGTSGASALVAQAQKDAEQLSRLHAMREKEFADQQTQELANTKKGLEAIAAERVKLADKTAADIAKANQASVKAQITAAAEISKAHVASMREQQKADEDFRSNELANLKAAIIARFKAEEENAKAHVASLRAQQKADEEYRTQELAQLKAAIIARAKGEDEAAAKQIQLDRQVAEVAKQVRQERIAGEEKAAAEQLQIFKRRMDAQRSTESVGGALSGFGGKMVLAHAAGMAAGDILGDRHGGQEIGSVVGGFAFGGPMIGATVAALQLMGTAIKAVREGTDAARKAAQEYTDTLERLGDTGSELVERTPFGSRMQKELDQSTTNIRKLTASIRELVVEGPSFSESLAHVLLGTPMSKLATGVKLSGLEDQLRVENQARVQNREARDRDDAAQRIVLQERVVAEQNLVGVQAMRPGLLKQEAELNAQINVRHAERRESERSQAQAADEAVARQTLMVKLAEESLRKAGPQAPTLVYKTLKAGVTAEKDKLADVQKARKDAADQAAAQRQIDEAQDNQAIVKLQVEHDARIEEQTSRTQQVQIRAETDGYRQRILLQEQAYAEREKKAADDGQEMVDLVKLEHQRILVIEQKAAKDAMDASRAAFDPASALSRFRKESAERHDIGHAAGASEKQIELWDREQLVGNYLRENEELRVELALKKKQITQEEADIQLGVIRNTLAQGNGPEAAAVKAQIAANAKLKSEVQEAADRQRAIEQITEKYEKMTEKPMSAGSFNTQLSSRIDFAALHGSFSDPGGLNAAAKQTQLQDEILHAILRMESKGGLN